MRTPLSRCERGATPIAPHGKPPGVHQKRYRGAGFAPNEVGQINGLARNYDADPAPRLDKSVRPRVGNEPTAGGLVSSASYVKAPDHALSTQMDGGTLLRLWIGG